MTLPLYRASRAALRKPSLPLVLASVAALTAAATAQTLPGQPGSDGTSGSTFTQYRPRAMATAIPSGEAPHIDGDLSDPAWQKAKVISDFYQIDPKEGAPASEHTEVRILHDADTLYISVRAFDREADKIVARIKQRDGDITKDDHVRIFLDPSHSGRNGFAFGVSPTGARYDALINNNNEFLSNWNTIWTAKPRITADGWQAEIAIPFRSISFRPGSDWGMDIWRTIRRKSEYVRWSGINKTLSDYNISQEGTLAGIGSVDTGIGLDVQAFALGRYQHIDDGNSGVSLRPSGNIFYKVTPSLTATLTTNTDFSDAPLDDRKVNTSRFSLFYPERRDFFLQDAPSFEFGGIPLSNDTNAMPFLSRRIGIQNGHAVNILGGAKLSGSEDGYGIGAMSVRTAGSGSVGEQQLSIIRLTAPTLSESKVGIVYTNGNPNGASTNNVAGTDFQYLNSHFLGDQILQLDSYYERSFDSQAGNGDSMGLTLNLPNEPWGFYFNAKQVGQKFDPALGYVSWNSIRSYNLQVTYTARFQDALLRSVTFVPFLEGTTGLDNRFESYDYGALLQFVSAGDDTLQIKYYNYADRPHETFTMPHDIPVLAGDYYQSTYYMEFVTSKSRPVYLDFTAQYDAGYYGGRRLYTDTIIKAVPDNSFEFDIEHVMKMMQLPHGDVTVHIGMIDGVWNFTPDMSLRSQLQYDNISEKFAASLRYRWEWQPGTELLVVLGEDATLAEGYQSKASVFSVRLGKTFRF